MCDFPLAPPVAHKYFLLTTCRGVICFLLVMMLLYNICLRYIGDHSYKCYTFLYMFRDSYSIKIMPLSAKSTLIFLICYVWGKSSKSEFQLILMRHFISRSTRNCKLIIASGHHCF